MVSIWNNIMLESDIINATFPEGIREWSRRPFRWSGEATTWESSPLNEEGPDVPFISVLRKSPPHPTFPSFSSTLCILNVWCWFSFRMYKLFNFTLDLCLFGFFWGMFIAVLWCGNDWAAEISSSDSALLSTLKYSRQLYLNNKHLF